MKIQNRTELIDEVKIPAGLAWELSQSIPELKAPPLNRLSDNELAWLIAHNSEEAQLEEQRRNEFAQFSIENKRAFWIKSTTNPHSGHSLWAILNDPKEDIWKKEIQYRSIYSSLTDAIYAAKSILENRDEGGVIYLDLDSYFKDYYSSIIYIWPNECEALTKTGKHDWLYVPTGDDVCRSCGLIV